MTFFHTHLALQRWSTDMQGVVQGVSKSSTLDVDDLVERFARLGHSPVELGRALKSGEFNPFVFETLLNHKNVQSALLASGKFDADIAIPDVLYNFRDTVGNVGWATGWDYDPASMGSRCGCSPRSGALSVSSGHDR